MAANQIHSQNEVIFHGSHDSPMTYSQLTNVSPMIGVDSRVTVFKLIVSGIDSICSALTSPRRIIDTSAPVSIVMAAGVPLIFPDITGLLPLVKLPIFTFLWALLSPARTSPKVLAVFSFLVDFGEEISVVCFVIEHDNRL